MFPMSAWAVAVLAAIVVGAVAAERDPDTLVGLGFNVTRAGIAGMLTLGFCLLTYAVTHW